jgi:1-acyl-sn-glycerol-3-phosphate acyltransferase
MKLGLFFYHKKIEVIGLENIPKKGAILFISNHPNALLDPLLIVTNNTRSLYFLARASAFKNTIVARFLKTIHMLPIYRKRDGVNTIEKNKAIFRKSVEIMNAQKTLYIAAEGSHNIQRRVRDFKKGFVYVILDTFKKYPELDIQIVPVGLNYDSVIKYPSSASIYYGKPISAKKYYDKNDSLSTTKHLLEVVRNSMKTLTTHIEDEENYDTIITKLNALNVDYLNPIETNKIIHNLDTYTEKKLVKKKKNLLYYLVVLNSLIPWLIWKKVEKSITEIEFVSTFRFSIGVTIFPFFYSLQSLLINHFFGIQIAVLYFILAIILGLILTKTSIY